MDPHVREQVEAMQPRKGALLLLIPAGMVVLTFVLYGAMLALGLYGRPADGARVALRFTGCPDARPVVARRVEGMGLGDPVFTDDPDGFTLTVTLPSDVRVADAIPGTLAAPGALAASPVGDPERVLLTDAHVASAAIRQDLTLIPWTVLTLTPDGLAALAAFVREDREGRLAYTLDGVPIGSVSNLKGPTPEVELTPEGADDRDRMEKAAARAIVLDSGPLPCAVSVGAPVPQAVP